MERLVTIVDQLEETKRLILIGDLSRLRLALLLLDNASEILMYRAVVQELSWRDRKGRIFSSATNHMSGIELDALKKDLGYEPLSAKARKTLLWEYDAKVDFLSTVKEDRRLPIATGRVLKATHRYRNEAYHRDRIRRATIEPVVFVLFEIVTDLLLILQPGTRWYSSNDDWTAFCKRYGFDHPSQALHEGVPVIVHSLKDGMATDVSSIAAGLAGHLTSRIHEVERALESVSENSGADLTPAAELRRIQFWSERGYVPQTADDPEFSQFVPDVSLDLLTTWRHQAGSLAAETDKLDLFAHFADLEALIEPLEEKIHEAASLVDQAIQAEIDRRRGK